MGRFLDCLFLSFGTVFGTGTLPIRYAGRIQRSPDDMITHAGQILNAAAADQHDRVLLEIMTFPGNIRCDLHAVRQSDPGDFAQGRVRFLRRHRPHLKADAPFLRAGVKSWRLGLLVLLFPALPD